jgi:hypothetical protein
MALPVAKLGTLALRTLSKPIASRLKSQAAVHPKFRNFIIAIAQVSNLPPLPPLLLCPLLWGKYLDYQLLKWRCLPSPSIRLGLARFHFLPMSAKSYNSMGREGSEDIPAHK